MSKDYIKKRQAKAHSGASRQFVFILAAYLCGYLTATIFDFTSLKTWVNKHILKATTLDHGAKIVAHKPDIPKPKFEFYTLLAKDSSETIAKAAQDPKLELATTAAMPAKPVELTPTVSNTISQQAIETVKVTEAVPVAKPAKIIDKDNYTIQIASFNKRQDAERLKASLLLRGFSASITEISQRSVSWYRVIIGPFDSRQQAEKAQILLVRTERMKGMIRKNG